MDFTPITSIINAFITSGTTIAAIWLTNKLSQKKRPDLGDPDFEDLLQPLLDSIQSEMKASRVGFWEGKNGMNTLSGYHIKTLNLMVESNASNVDLVKQEMQDIPAEIFKRNMKLLAASPTEYIISQEDQNNDDLANINQGYGISTLITFKIYTKFHRWTSLVTIGFDKPTELSHLDLSWLTVQVSRISQVLKNS